MLDGLMVAPWQPHRVAIGVKGSYPALKPIIDKYRPYATAIYFPYPRPLSATPPQGDTPALMTMVFEIDQLARAAHAAPSFALPPSAPTPNVSATPVPPKP
jgi:hypothetical protein